MRSGTEEGTGDLAFSNLFEDQIGGVLSDRIVIIFDPNADVNGLDIKFSLRSAALSV